MAKQFIWSLSYSLLLHRNNMIITQKQYMFYRKLGTNLIYYIFIKQFILSVIQYSRSDKFLLRQKIYKQNWQTAWIIVKNKNIHAKRTKQFIWSFIYRLLLPRNNMIMTQKQYMFFLKKLAQTKISVHIVPYCNKILINCNNINNKIDPLLTFYCHSDTIKTISLIVVENQKYTILTDRRFGS
jgi:hypothetical protein